MGKTRIEVNPKLTSTLVFFRALSFYDEKERKRKIKKAQASSRKIAEEVVRSKNSVNKDINIYKKEGIIVEDSDGYYIQDIPKEQSSIELPQEFLVQMNRTFHQDYIKVYCWLYRELVNYHQPLFSCKRIAEQALGLSYNKDRVDKINEILYQLALNGLIVIADIKVKTTVNDKPTFMGKLLEIRTEFRTIEMVKNIVNQQLGGAEDFTGDELLLTENDYEVGTTIGFTEKMLEQASEEEFLIEEKPKIGVLSDKPPIDFLSGDDLREGFNKNANTSYAKEDDEKMIRRLNANGTEGRNEPYLEYVLGFN